MAQITVDKQEMKAALRRIKPVGGDQVHLIYSPTTLILRAIGLEHIAETTLRCHVRGHGCATVNRVAITREVTEHGSGPMGIGGDPSSVPPPYLPEPGPSFLADAETLLQAYTFAQCRAGKGPGPALYHWIGIALHRGKLLVSAARKKSAALIEVPGYGEMYALDILVPKDVKYALRQLDGEIRIAQQGHYLRLRSSDLTLWIRSLPAPQISTLRILRELIICAEVKVDAGKLGAVIKAAPTSAAMVYLDGVHEQVRVSCGIGYLRTLPSLGLSNGGWWLDAADLRRILPRSAGDIVFHGQTNVGPILVRDSANPYYHLITTRRPE